MEGKLAHPDENIVAMAATPSAGVRHAPLSNRMDRSRVIRVAEPEVMLLALPRQHARTSVLGDEHQQLHGP
jgi:hypothetical protein